jgi:hypothetical protein
VVAGRSQHLSPQPLRLCDALQIVLGKRWPHCERQRCAARRVTTEERAHLLLDGVRVERSLAALMSSSAGHSENDLMRRSRALPVCQWEHDQQDAMRMLVKQSSSSGRSIPRTSPTPGARTPRDRSRVIQMDEAARLVGKDVLATTPPRPEELRLHLAVTGQRPNGLMCWVDGGGECLQAVCAARSTEREDGAARRPVSRRRRRLHRSSLPGLVRPGSA